MKVLKLLFYIFILSIVTDLTAEQTITFKSRHKFELTYPSHWFLDSARIEKLSFLDDDLHSRTLILTNYLPYKIGNDGKFRDNELKIDIHIRRISVDSLANIIKTIRKEAYDSILLNKTFFYIRTEIDEMTASENKPDKMIYFTCILNDLVFVSTYFPNNTKNIGTFKKIIGSITISK